ncbi:hypothetical protein [Streptomyces sp. NPDC059378]|uniref:hypothetical protein n=1 Tax=Streptomyces sp. NPDC059378 TaxID=3346815 RepID=UPI0036B66A01
MTVQMDAVQFGETVKRTAKDGGGQEPSDAPVFVDESGRRSRTFRRIGIAVGIACAAYAAVIVVTLLSGNSSAPWLPVPVPGQDDDKPAGQVDTSPAPSATSRPTHAGPGVPVLPGGTSPGGATATAGTPKPSASGSSGSPSASADPKPSASASARPSPSSSSKSPVAESSPPVVSSPSPSGPGDGSPTPTPPASPDAGAHPVAQASPDAGAHPVAQAAPAPVTVRSSAGGASSNSSSHTENVL